LKRRWWAKGRGNRRRDSREKVEETVGKKVEETVEKTVDEKKSDDDS